MKKAIILYILLLVTVTGCIKENLDDCETTLYFSYLGDGTKEIFPQKIEKVDMYIQSEQCICTENSSQPERAQPPTRHYLEFAKRSISHYMLGKLPQRHTDKRGFILAKQPGRSPALFYERVDIDQ